MDAFELYRASFADLLWHREFEPLSAAAEDERDEALADLWLQLSPDERGRIEAHFHSPAGRLGPMWIENPVAIGETRHPRTEVSAD